jgi:hypothetical protein
VRRPASKLILPQFVVERGPIGHMMHAGFSRWMAGEEPPRTLAACDLRRVRPASRDASNPSGDQESALSHYITAGVAGSEVAQVRLASLFVKF